MIKGLIFDLDHCIFDTFSMGRDLLKPVIASMQQADKTGFLSREKYNKISRDLWSHDLEEVIKLNAIPSHIARPMRQSYADLEVPDCSKNYDDAVIIKNLKPIKILVTSGYLKFQLSKIKKTKIESFFDEIIVDAFDDPEKIKGKFRIFKEVMAKYNWLPKEVMVLGNSPNSELRVGRDLKMITVQTIRPGVNKAKGFNFYINNFGELKGIISKLN